MADSSDIADPKRESRGTVPQRVPKNVPFYGRFGRRAGALLAVLFSVAIIAIVAFALRQRTVPARCPKGRIPLSHRCCLEGQALSGNRCVGTPQTCTEPYRPAPDGCVLEVRRVPIPGGQVLIAPNDWQAEGLVTERLIEVSTFLIDATEARLTSGPEPDLPITSVSAEEAQQSCAERGGRLPTFEEWIFAAAGSEGRRYAWGQTGLVCRRAVYGLEEGPCAFTETAGPEAVASRPDGVSPEGVYDLIGNVAEWVVIEDGYAAMGGSYRSRVASELKVWSSEPVRGEREDVGFRCAYGGRQRRPIAR